MQCSVVKAFLIVSFGLLSLSTHAQSSEGGMFEFESTFATVRELLEADAKLPLSAEDLDTELWLLLTRVITQPKDLKTFPAVVGTYFSSRYVQWEVGNGGFVQGAENIPEWFAAAEAGYATLGKHNSAALIHKARALLPLTDEAALERRDAEIPSVEWEIDS